MKSNFKIETLGECTVSSPISSVCFVEDSQNVRYDAVVTDGKNCSEGELLELAGPRKKIFFNPEKTKAAIVTCGGLCPGLNDVIRGLVMVLWYMYGVKEILGIRYGYQGLTFSSEDKPVKLSPEVVEDINTQGGTILGSSRGDQSPVEIADFLVKNGINILFTIGGDGTQRGALKIAEEIKKRGEKIAVIGIPKTIDNDIAFTERTFGFETAIEMSRLPVICAHKEAKGAKNGIGLVKLMGRDSGFIAANATMATSDVNLILVPEVDFRLENVMKYLEWRMLNKSHAVIVVAEGAGQNYVKDSGTDASGNKLHGDIGLFLKDKIKDYFRGKNIPVSIKYIDPSYTIRSSEANANDSVFCFQLAENAVHAAMTGRTAMVISLWNNHFVNIPVQKSVEYRKKIDPNGLFWQSVLNNTGQPEMK
ncbi:MAG: ATP-dependent 6-phosphofructokinase [Spirochaetes bacterium]|nr:ATP-dependent 6-phosphofructokinase [Spirochaetota bacterium]